MKEKFPYSVPNFVDIPLTFPATSFPTLWRRDNLCPGNEVCIPWTVTGSAYWLLLVWTDIIFAWSKVSDRFKPFIPGMDDLFLESLALTGTSSATTQKCRAYGCILQSLPLLRETSLKIQAKAWQILKVGAHWDYNTTSKLEDTWVKMKRRIELQCHKWWTRKLTRQVRSQIWHRNQFLVLRIYIQSTVRVFAHKRLE
jgi:hypothetical protein